jgi:hypothetical protein
MRGWHRHPACKDAEKYYTTASIGTRALIEKSVAQYGTTGRVPDKSVLVEDS